MKGKARGDRGIRTRLQSVVTCGGIRDPDTPKGPLAGKHIRGVGSTGICARPSDGAPYETRSGTADHAAAHKRGASPSGEVPHGDGAGPRARKVRYGAARRVRRTDRSPQSVCTASGAAFTA